MSVCLYLRTPLTVGLIWFSFIAKLLIGPGIVSNNFIISFSAKTSNFFLLLLSYPYITGNKYASYPVKSIVSVAGKAAEPEASCCTAGR